MRRRQNPWKTARIGPFHELLYWPTTPPLPIVPFFLRLENTDFLLKEDGFKLQLES